MAPRGILDLPAEMIDVIVHQIDHGPDRANFSRSCHAFHDRVMKALIDCVDVTFAPLPVEERPHPSSLLFARGISTTRIERLGIDECSGLVRTNCIVKDSNVNDRSRQWCHEGFCRACTLTRSLCRLDMLLASNLNKKSAGHRSLICRGQFGERTRRMYITPMALNHAILGRRGLAAMQPQIFEFNMDWRFWDIAILEVLSLSHLVVLKVPIGIPSDCEDLGSALVSMVNLKSLTVRDIPDLKIYLDELPFLGCGILARSDSLRELDLTMTDANRLDHWVEGWNAFDPEDEKIECTDDYDYQFGALFPKSVDDLTEEVQGRYLDFKSSIGRRLTRPCHRRLRLEKLRFKHVDLPYWAFTDIIDGTNLKELRLPDCEVDYNAWSKIGTNSLIALEDIMLLNLGWWEEDSPGQCLSFARLQHTMQSLSFERTPSAWQKSYSVWWSLQDEAPTQYMTETDCAPLMGPGTAWGGQQPWFPNLQTLLTLLKEVKIKSLVLPPGMYDITASAMCAFGIGLQWLEHLTWAFDYGDTEVRQAFENCFLDNIPSLRRITFLSTHLPIDYYGTWQKDARFDAPTFHGFIASLGERVPSTIRYIRYRHLRTKDGPGNRHKTTVYYHRRKPENGNWWILLDGLEGETMFDEDRTPLIWPRSDST